MRFNNVSINGYIGYGVVGDLVDGTASSPCPKPCLATKVQYYINK